MNRPIYDASHMEESMQFQRLIQFLKRLSQQPHLFYPYGKHRDIELDKKSESPLDEMDDAKDAFPGLLKVRPQRENRRYLLWRKITGKK